MSVPEEVMTRSLVATFNIAILFSDGPPISSCAIKSAHYFTFPVDDVDEM